MPNVTAETNALREAYASVILQDNGAVYVMQDNVQNPAGAWRTGGTNSNNLEVKATRTSGTTPTSGTVGQWLPLTAVQSWSVRRSSKGITVSVLLLEFRNNLNPAVILDTATVTLRAVVEDAGLGDIE